jgi:alkanesulfonate monooxygenase SsuD/methylene tetrahydromethanopterin reductase-like flavin-dependent oxidoreductase (luciferase family)
VLSTDEPIRVFQQLATAAAIAPGRIDVVAGRGSSDITFSIFDLDERDYDMLFSSKLELLLALNSHERITWSGPHRRRPLKDVLVVPRPEQPLRIWLGTGEPRVGAAGCRTRNPDVPRHSGRNAGALGAVWPCVTARVGERRS